jgi:hypothetical protein
MSWGKPTVLLGLVAGFAALGCQSNPDHREILGTWSLEDHPEVQYLSLTEGEDGSVEGLLWQFYTFDSSTDIAYRVTAERDLLDAWVIMIPRQEAADASNGKAYRIEAGDAFVCGDCIIDGESMDCTSAYTMELEGDERYLAGSCEWRRTQSEVTTLRAGDPCAVYGGVACEVTYGGLPGSGILDCEGGRYVEVGRCDGPCYNNPVGDQDESLGSVVCEGHGLFAPVGGSCYPEDGDSLACSADGSSILTCSSQTWVELERCAGSTVCRRGAGGGLACLTDED